MPTNLAQAALDHAKQIAAEKADAAEAKLIKSIKEDGAHYALAWLSEDAAVTSFVHNYLKEVTVEKAEGHLENITDILLKGWNDTVPSSTGHYHRAVALDKAKAFRTLHETLTRVVAKIVN